MAENLLKLGLLLDNESYKKQSLDMVDHIGELIVQEISYLSQWASVANLLVKPIPEIVIFGNNYLKLAKELNALNIPLKVVAASSKKVIYHYYEIKLKSMVKLGFMYVIIKL